VFYCYEQTEGLEILQTDIKMLEEEIVRLLKEVIA